MHTSTTSWLAFLPLGPPVKDPTNYFWTVLQDLQALVQRHKVADVEFLLNMADTPVVFAQDDGKPSVPIPIFSYCKTRRFLDILIPGYYSPAGSDLPIPCGGPSVYCPGGEAAPILVIGDPMPTCLAISISWSS